MGLLGLSLLLATAAVYVFVHPPAWLSRFGLAAAARARLWPPAATRDALAGPGRAVGPTPPAVCLRDSDDGGDDDDDNVSLVPPPPPASLPAAPPAFTPPSAQAPEMDDAAGPDSPPTPRALASSHSATSDPVSTLSLSGETSSLPASTNASASSSSSASSMLPPPPPPPRPSSSSRRIPILAPFPVVDSLQRAGRIPPGSNRLVPPAPPASTPSRPGRKVLLAPGRSPLDWARLTSGPDAHSLRGLPARAPYLRVPPSLLRQHTGRRGSDAWMALNGRVYNISPYAEYHPGGVPELMRGAGRDATALFAGIHPWVNYEAMLAPCFIGLVVDEPAPGAAVAQSDMDKMD